MTATAEARQQGGEPQQFASPHIPKFEGKEVALTRAKITSVTGLEVDDAVWGIDEFIKLTVETRVVSVYHQVNQQTGKLERIHVLKAVDCRVLPWED